MIVFIGRCRSNYIGLNESLNKINIVEPADCDCGHGVQDLNHVIWRCTKLQAQRETFLKEMVKKKYFLPYDVTSFLFGPNITVMKMIDYFLKKCVIKVLIL